MIAFRKKLILGAASLALLCTPALAADESASLSGSIALTSDYRFRGISQNDTDPAPQLTLNLVGPDGWYAGTFLSKINFNDGPSGAYVSNHNTSLEWDIYAGKHFDLDGTGLTLQALYYAYPEHDGLPGAARLSFFEGSAALSHTFDNLTVGATVAVSPDFFGESGTGVWLGGTASYVVNDWVTVSGNVGHQWAETLNNAGTGFPYTHWDLGVTATWNGISLDLRYIDTSINKGTCEGFNGPRNNWCGPTAVATVSYAFDVFGG